MIRQEIVRYLVESPELDPVVGRYVGRQPLQHQQYLRPAADVGVDSDWEDRLVVFPIDEVELVPPHLLDVPGVDEAVAVGRSLDEHHWRQVVQVPVGRYLHRLRGPVVGVQPHHQRATAEIWHQV